jgi:hypothetical protein
LNHNVVEISMSTIVIVREMWAEDLRPVHGADPWQSYLPRQDPARHIKGSRPQSPRRLDLLGHSDRSKGSM